MRRTGVNAGNNCRRRRNPTILVIRHSNGL
jgi:hypothetical protein